MAQSMTTSIFNNNKEKGRRNSNKKSSKPNSPISPDTKGGHFFAKFGKAIRRRSVSADEIIFRKRGGTISSIDSLKGGGGGEDSSYSSNTNSRKSSALNRMKERLNKWKISG
ncbi:hypothetical protein Mgra_00002198 [Meloidogyne graminicola]|uniref:Uncharacterized protein n=1 Tax=Meloidogyne graminicola TaxID=189291 RepID=A0A8S9ZY81_9BILA|nr:hypothetical protein Mgra_00002198 [Meloidogyne graminicola]